MEGKILSKLLQYIFIFILFSSVVFLFILNNNKPSQKFSDIRFFIFAVVLFLTLINIMIIEKSNNKWQSSLTIIGLWGIMLYSIADVWYFIVIGSILILPAYALYTFLNFNEEIGIINLAEKNYIKFQFPFLTQPVFHWIISISSLFLYYILINASIVNIPFIFDFSETGLRNPINLYGILDFYEPDDFSDYMYNLAILHRILIIVFIFVCQIKLYTISPMSDKQVFRKIVEKKIYYYEFFIYFLGLIDIIFTTYEIFLHPLIKYFKNETSWYFVEDDFPALILYYIQVILLSYIIYNYSNKLRIINKMIVQEV